MQSLVSIDFDVFTSPFTPYILFQLKRYITPDGVSSAIQTSRSNLYWSKIPENTSLRVVFSSVFPVFGYLD